MIYPVYPAETIEIDGCLVELIRRFVSTDDRESAHWTYGWKVTIGKEQYGDWTRLLESATISMIDEMRRTLIEQASIVITRVLSGCDDATRLREGAAPEGNRFQPSAELTVKSKEQKVGWLGDIYETR